MKHIYHIRCDPDFDKGFCDMRCITFDCTGCVEQLSKPWLYDLDKTLQPRYSIEPKKCKYYSILRGYNKWYIFKLDFKRETTYPYEMEIKDELVLHGMTWAAANYIEYNTIGAFQTSDSNTPGYYIV